MHQRIIGLYEEHAEAWEAARREFTPHERPHFDRFIAALPGGARLLDIGCGSGVPVARELIGRKLQVTGIDSSPSMIARCQRRFPEQEWHVADMRALHLGRRFDALLAWYSFFHLHADDQRAMFPIFAAHAAPGALLMFTTGPVEGERIGSWQGEPLYHASLSQTEYRQLLAASGFETLAFTAGEPLAQGPSVWLARFAGP
jgi:SAM-dependent methyltransferase